MNLPTTESVTTETSGVVRIEIEDDAESHHGSTATLEDTDKGTAVSRS